MLASRSKGTGVRSVAIAVAIKRRLFSSRPLIQKIKNPPGYEASNAEIFSHHPKKIRKLGNIFCRINHLYHNQTSIHYPPNTLVGLKVTFSSTSTLGRLESQNTFYQKFAIYNEQVHLVEESDWTSFMTVAVDPIVDDFPKKKNNKNKNDEDLELENPNNRVPLGSI